MGCGVSRCGYADTWLRIVYTPFLVLGGGWDHKRRVSYLRTQRG